MLTVFPLQEEVISSGEHTGRTCIIRPQTDGENAHSDKGQVKISAKILAGVN